MEEKDIRELVKRINVQEAMTFYSREAKTINEYRATHPECRWCVHNSDKASGSHCAVKDKEYVFNSGLIGKVRASLCPCYCIK